MVQVLRLNHELQRTTMQFAQAWQALAAPRRAAAGGQGGGWGWGEGRCSVVFAPASLTSTGST